MKHYLNLVPISAKIHRKQSKMTRICITLAVFLVAIMFGLADMYLQGAIQKQMRESGNWHYQLHSIDTQTAASVSARPEVEIAGWHNAISSDIGYSLEGRPIAVSAQDKSVFEHIFLGKVIEGEYPDAENEIAVSSSLKNSASLSLNGTIQLSCPDGSTVSYLVVGFLDDIGTWRLGVGSVQTAVLTPEGFTALSVPANTSVTESYVLRFSRHCNIPDTIAAIKEQNNVSNEQMTGNLPLLSIQGQLEGETGVNQIYQVALILSVIVMLTCILMISSSLNSNVAQQTEFFGMLRCLGATKKQIMRQENQVLFVQTENTDVQVGDIVTLSVNNAEYTVTVAGVLSDSPLARVGETETIFCSEKTFTALTGQTGYTVIDVQFQNNASGDDVKEIEKIFSNDSVVIKDKLLQVQRQRNLYHAFSILVYGFLFIIVVITIFHIRNTINMGVAARTKEYGAMRAIGMSRRQLVKMIVSEAVAYAVSGVIWGCIIGLPMHWGIYVSLITNFWGTAWSMPFIPLSLIIAIVLLTSLFSVREPAKRLHKMSIVENISAG